MQKKIKKVILDGLEATVINLSVKVDKLVYAMGAGFNEMKAGFKKVDEDIEALAQITAHGFDDVMSRIGNLDECQTRLQQGQQNIQLRLRVDSLSPQFEVKILERRVRRLEDSTGIRHTLHSQ